MKIAVLEPLGIPYEELREKVEKAAGPENEVVCYETREEVHADPYRKKPGSRYGGAFQL
ncbi:MAG: hypothetical protein V8Q42_10955 [Anaerovoracaceae bacterium]